MYFDFMYLLFIAPAVLLGMFAQWWVSSSYAKASRMPASMTGFAAARRILDDAGLHQVDVVQIPGHLSDHYDPGPKVLRLSGDVYHGRSLASVGIAAHEAGHALQDAHRYFPLVIRNLAVPAASFGSSTGYVLIFLGFILSWSPLIWIGIGLFSAVAFFQLVNLPVEFNASSRAKAQLQDLGIVSPEEMGPVRRVLTAAALTYVAKTLQVLLTLVYYVMRASGRRR